MKSNSKRIAALAALLAALVAPALVNAAGAVRCETGALTCFASGTPAAARDASFLDLMRMADARPADEAAARPAHVAAVKAAPAMAPAGVGAIDSAMGTEMANPGVPAWLALPRSIAAPDASVAWIFGIGFLGFVILRRVRAAPDY